MAGSTFSRRTALRADSVPTSSVAGIFNLDMMLANWSRRRPSWHTMIASILHDRPDRVRIVNSHNVKRFPDCDAYGLDYKPHLHHPERLMQNLTPGFNITPDRPKKFFLQKIGRRTRA
jgi:hypothetical protein